jgi:ABC-type dipeptide/oligopeptide/nickel transport system permease subunit
MGKPWRDVLLRPLSLEPQPADADHPVAVDAADGGDLYDGLLLEAVLGYIGVGVTGAVDGGEFTVVSWGGMFFSGRSALSRNPLMLIIPSLCILLMSMSFILLADALEGAHRQE